MFNNVMFNNAMFNNVLFQSARSYFMKDFRSGLETDGAAGRPFMDDSCGCFSRPFSTLKCCGNMHDFLYFYVLALNIYNLKINYY